MKLHELTYSQACIEHYQSQGMVADSSVLLLWCSILIEQSIEEELTLFGSQGFWGCHEKSYLQENLGSTKYD